MTSVKEPCGLKETELKSSSKIETDDLKADDKSQGKQAVMSASEYAESFRCWLHQQQCIQQMNMASYQFLYNLHLLATNNYFNHLRSLQQTTVPAPSAAYSNAIPQRPEVAGGRECRIPALWERLMAELIDFLLLFILKLGITLFILDNTTLLGPLESDMERLLTVKWSSENAVKILPHMLALEFVNRVFISVFEAMSIRQGTRGCVGGSTPGKRLMGLRVVYCERIVTLPLSPDKVLVVPATDLLFARALVRSLFKNFSFIILPVFLTSILFEHNRSLYDLLASSVVVFVGVEFAPNFRA